jgi:hypothetical protein
VNAIRAGKDRRVPELTYIATMVMAVVAILVGRSD